LYPVRILSIDGGGIRGIIPLKILDYIEKKTEKPIHQLFNVIGGTSTGGIIALGLNASNPAERTGKVYTVEQLMKFYTEDANQLFSYRWESLGGWLLSSYRARNIEDYLQHKFGDTTLLSQLPTAKDCVVIVYSYDVAHNEPFEFTNNPQQGNDGLVWQAARATSAAPTFFPAFKFKDPNENEEKLRVLIDGGVFINNPALNLLLEARKKYPQIKQQNQLLVSIGTGDFNPYKEHFKWSGKLGWAGSIFGVTSMATSSETDGQLTELLEYFDARVPWKEKELKEWTEKRYYRFQKQFEKDVPMDGISEKQIKHLEQLGDKLVEEQQEELDQLCEVLAKPIESEIQLSSS
jgi:patatin-like phospholipase/acyl hydrolase